MKVKKRTNGRKFGLGIESNRNDFMHVEFLNDFESNKVISRLLFLDFFYSRFLWRLDEDRVKDDEEIEGGRWRKWKKNYVLVVHY